MATAKKRKRPAWKPMHLISPNEDPKLTKARRVRAQRRSEQIRGAKQMGKDIFKEMGL